MEATLNEYKNELIKGEVCDERASIGLAIPIGAGIFIQEKQAKRYINKHRQKNANNIFPISHHERGNGDRQIKGSMSREENKIISSEFLTA